MEQILIKDTYKDCLSYLLDLYQYYSDIIVKKTNICIKIKLNNKYKDSTKAKLLDNINLDIIYWQDKKEHINEMIELIKNNKIESIKFI